MGVSERCPARVIVCDRVPIRRRALARALEQVGFTPVELAHIDLTSDEPAGTVVVWSCDDYDLSTSPDLSFARDQTRVVALLSDPSLDQYRKALSRGVASVASHGASLQDLMTLISLVQQGWAVVPVEVAREIARDEPDSGPSLAPHEVQWLKNLAAGVVIRDLAADAGLPEREMYRALHSVYEKLRASGRIEAIATAARLGLLAE